MGHLNFYAGIDNTLRMLAATELLIWPPAEEKNIPHRYTGQAILDHVANIGAALKDQGITNGQKVLLALPVSFDLVGSLLAVMAIGAIPVLPPAAASRRNWWQLLRHQQIKLIITGQKPTILQRWATKLLSVRFLNIADLNLIATAWLVPQNVPATQAALITHSSGSTGKPKFIVRSHRVLQAQHHVLKDVFPPWPGQRDFPLFPNILLHNLSVGTLSILPQIPWPNFTQLKPAEIIRQLLHDQVDSLTGNVYYFRQLLTYLPYQPQQFSKVKAVGIGGSPVPENLVNALNPFFPAATFYIIYGSSEAEPIAVREVAESAADPAQGYPAGYICAGLECRIEPLGKLIFQDKSTVTVGEIMVRGAHVATATPADWWASGDYGYIAADGKLYLTGRRGNERLHGGVQHYQIEHVLLHQPGVKQAAARATPTGFDLYVTGAVPEADLRATLGVYFPVEIFNKIYFRQELPVDDRHHSKIRYDQLK